MRWILLLLLFFSYAFSQPTLYLINTKKPIDATKYITFTEDINEDLTPHNILDNNTLKQLPSKNYGGVSKHSYWTKLVVQNRTQKKQNLIFYNERTRLNYVNVFIYKKDGKDDLLVKKHLLGDLVKPSKKELPSRYALMQYVFEPNEKITIVTNIQNNALYNLSWKIIRIHSYIQKESLDLLFWGLFGGILLLAFSFNLFMYKMHQQKGYLIIAIHCIIFLIYQYSMHGILYKLDLGYPMQWNITIFLSFGTLLIACLMLFPYYFFNTQENYPKIRRIIQVMIVCYALIIVLLFYAQYYNAQMFQFTVSVLLWAYIINSIASLSIGIYMFKNKETGSVYYLFGQGFLALALIIYIAAMVVSFPYSNKANDLLILTIIMDLFFLFIAQYIKTKQKQKVLYRNKEVLMDQSRFSSIGQAIGNITHQWKHPLSQLGSSITLIEATLSHQKENLEEKVVSQLPHINHCINLMQKTIDEFASFYKAKTNKEAFNVYQSIQEVTEILKPKAILKNVQVKTDIDQRFTIQSHEHIFSNIMLILLDNSLNAFQTSNENLIHISVENYLDKIIIYYQDNAGGIKIRPIESVFEYFISSKKNEEGQGMGLPILKMLVEERLGGQVKLKNSARGVFFEIHISTKTE